MGPERLANVRQPQEHRATAAGESALSVVGGGMVRSGSGEEDAHHVRHLLVQPWPSHFSRAGKVVYRDWARNSAQQRRLSLRAASPPATDAAVPLRCPSHPFLSPVPPPDGLTRGSRRGKISDRSISEIAIGDKNARGS